MFNIAFVTIEIHLPISSQVTPSLVS